MIEVRVFRVLHWLQRFQVGRRGMYGFFLIAGVYSIPIPSALVSQALGVGVYVWVVFLITGGLVSLWGNIIGWDLMEATGLAPLWGALGVYGAAALIQSGNNPTRVTLGLVFLAFAFGLYGRFTEILVRDRQDREARCADGCN